jgi:hypothetical protein
MCSCITYLQTRHDISCLFDMSLPDLLLAFIRYCLIRSIIKHVDGANNQLEIIYIISDVLERVQNPKPSVSTPFSKYHI